MSTTRQLTRRNLVGYRERQGMCSRCAKQDRNNNPKWCSQYDKDCQRVARNCPGNFYPMAGNATQRKDTEQ